MALFPWNMVLYVPEGSTSLSYDNYGNPVEAKAGVGEYLISVSEESPQLKANPGADTNTATYSGRCVGKVKDLTIQGDGRFARTNIDERAKFLPASVAAGERFQIMTVDPATKQTQRGSFVVLSGFQSRFKGVTKVLGSYVTGYFEFGR